MFTSFDSVALIYFLILSIIYNSSNYFPINNAKQTQWISRNIAEYVLKIQIFSRFEYIIYWFDINLKVPKEQQNENYD